MAITLDRKSPGIFGILFGAALSIALGSLIALVHLAAQPVEVVASAPKEPAEGVHYFIQGAPGGGAGKTWENKQDQIQSGSGEVGFTEAELNAWSAGTFKQPEMKKADKEESFMIIAGIPNFRIVGKELQVGTVNTVNFFGKEGPLVLQGRGGFVRSGGGWRFKPSEAWLGGLPLHRIPALLPVVAERLGVGKTPPASVETMLKRAADISVQGEELVVRMP